MFSRTCEVTVITAPYDKVEEYVNNNLDGPYNYKMILVVADRPFNSEKRVVFITRNGVVRSNTKMEYECDSFIKCALRFTSGFKYTPNTGLAKLMLDSIKVTDQHLDNITNVEILYTEMGFLPFVRRFENGFSGYTDADLDIIRKYESDFAEYVRNVELYEGVHKGLNIHVAISGEYKYKRRLCKYLLSTGDYDFCIVVNYANKSLYIMNAFTDECNSSVEIAKDMCGKYSGDEYAVGGKFNQAFLEFGATLKECK
jgi:hypothetical protein